MDQPKSSRIPLFRVARYPQAYVWFIFVSALDLMMTWVVLYFGGREPRGIGFLPMQTMELCLIQKTGLPPIYNHKASMLFGGTGKTLLWLSASLAAKKGH